MTDPIRPAVEVADDVMGDAEYPAIKGAVVAMIEADREAIRADERAKCGIPENARWGIGATVQKKRGSAWRGKVVGFYTTEHTPIGYAVESHFEPGSVQVWPEAAMDDWRGDHAGGGDGAD